MQSMTRGEVESWGRRRVEERQLLFRESLDETDRNGDA